MDFNSLKFSPDLISVTKELGYTTLTPIQEQAIPPLMDGKDVIGQSKTGSGKTVAFALPILEKIDLSNKYVQAVILCPTRELANQVAREIRKLGRRKTALQVLVVCGGLPLRDQIDALNNGVHIVVGTPGRMVDLIKRDRFPCQDVRTLVLDEADQMLDMGFEEDMQLILSELPETRQTAFFSATYPDSIQALSKKYQHKPVRITIEEDAQQKADITQGYFTTEPEEKMPMLMRLLRRADPESVLIFCNLKTTVSEIGQALANEHFSVATLTGDLEQRDRDAVMARFRNGSVRVLVSTDVAARGLDIENLPMVINYDLPGDPEIYVHRIGRTGRAGKTGLAYSFVSESDMIAIGEMQILTGRPFDKATLPPKVQHQRPPRPAEMRTLVIAGGRKDKVRPGDLLGALTGEAGGFQKTEIGKIEIHDHCAYVAVREEIAKSAYRGLSQGRIKGQRFPVFLLE